MSKRARAEAIEGYLWISPWVIGFLVFVLGPMLASFGLSFSRYSALAAPNFVGLENYEKIFFGDKLFYPAVAKTLYFALAIVPLGVMGSLLLAVLLNQAMRFRTMFRTFYFLPSLTPTVSLTLIWLWIFNPDIGLANYLVGLIGIEGPGWFYDPDWAIPALIIMHLWASVGGGRMIIFLAALQGVPEELYEAAEIDGANTWHKFLHITFPMVSPAVLFNMILGVIGALNVFQTAYIATEGGPARATWFLALHIYYNAFRYTQFGYASALAWVFFAIVLVFTIIQLEWSAGWVHYAGGE